MMKQKLITAFVVAVALVGAFRFGADHGYEAGDRAHNRDVSGSLVLQCRSNISDADVQEARVIVFHDKRIINYAGKLISYDRASAFIDKGGVVTTLMADHDYAQLAISGDFARLHMMHNNSTVNHMNCQIVGNAN